MLEHIGAVACVVFLFRVLYALPGVFSQRRSIAETLQKTVMITGATDGIGRACAFRLRQLGVMRIILAGRDRAKLDSLRGELKKLSADASQGTIVETVRFDFSDDTNYDEILKAIRDVQPDSLINCAGISYPSALYYHELPLEFINKMINVNVLTPLVVASAVLHSRRTRNASSSCAGSILLLGSASSLVAEPLLVAYAATKAAVDGFMQVLNAEHWACALGVQTHVPLMVTTKMSKIKTPSFFVPSAPAYARRALEALRYASNRGLNDSMCPTVCPYLPHYLLLIVASITPRYIFERVRLSQQKVVRSKYLKKTGGEVLC